MSLIGTADSLDLDFQNVPIIDLRNISSKDPLQQRRLAEEIRDACIRVGFFYGSSHPWAVANNYMRSLLDSEEPWHPREPNRGGT
ncbi:hypothetical protein CPB84DRAFT_375704 [Gymnopilus junonius]|uniref:Non-haem dioxygenase N-terminal domain-containing protein n=1 Tax=Gymnopilus junonius TaxID=109634 RepID=A0A9P5THL3_GYMJU|nr:hypothetical protein CPB84DRAFT_375704 [Gymnopilus junonius]